MSATGIRIEDIFELSHVGRRVTVSKYGQGIVMFVGSHHVHGVPRIGVELDQPLGINNGTVGGHKYFTCTMKHGVLADPKLGKIIRRCCKSVYRAVLS